MKRKGVRREEELDNFFHLYVSCRTFFMYYLIIIVIIILIIVKIEMEIKIIITTSLLHMFIYFFGEATTYVYFWISKLVLTKFILIIFW